METIEFNEVIKQNIEVVGGLLPTVTEKKMVLQQSQCIIVYQNLLSQIRLMNM